MDLLGNQSAAYIHQPQQVTTQHRSLTVTELCNIGLVLLTSGKLLNGRNGASGAGKGETGCLMHLANLALRKDCFYLLPFNNQHLRYKLRHYLLLSWR